MGTVRVGRRSGRSSECSGGFPGKDVGLVSAHVRWVVGLRLGKDAGSPGAVHRNAPGRAPECFRPCSGMLPAVLWNAPVLRNAPRPCSGMPPGRTTGPAVHMGRDEGSQRRAKALLTNPPQRAYTARLRWRGALT